MVTAGLHATAMGLKSNCSSDKQWYSLVKLDPYGLGHGSCDGELAELEELILSEPDHRVLDDATGFTGLSDGDANSQFSDDAGDDARDEYRSVHAYKTQPQAYQKPGGPCDHCGAVGTCPATNLHHAFFLLALPNLFFPMARAVPPVGTPRTADAIANGPIAPSPRVVHVLHESNLTSIVPLRPLSIRRLAPVEEGSRVQADALQRLWHPLPEDEQPRALDPDGSRGPGGGAQKEDAPRISYVVAQPGEETPVRADRDHGHREPSSQRRARVTGRGSRGVDCRRAKEETGTGDKIASELSLYVIRRGK